MASMLSLSASQPGLNADVSQFEFPFALHADSKMTWTEANSFCVQQYGTGLASIRDSDEAETALSMVQAANCGTGAAFTRNTYIGLAQDEQSGDWLWDDGETCPTDCIDLPFWRSSRPVDISGRRCGVIWHKATETEEMMGNGWCDSTLCFLCRVGDAHCDHVLSQSDFESGTVRIAQSGTYCLTEDIVFNPRSECQHGPNSEGCFFPMDDTAFPGSTTFKDGAFALGFFAAITIEADGVTLDLKGFRIEWGFEFYLQQRFGSVIEIANSPFIPAVGPGTNFGANFVSTDNVVIQNGVIGLNSHHGIHSNGASNVVIQNMKFEDFEVAAIQLNGFETATFEDLDIGPSLADVPLSGHYSNARFLLLPLRELLDSDPSRTVTFAGGRTLSLEEIEQNLVDSMDLVYDVLTGSVAEDDVADNELYQKGKSLFMNTAKLPDGSAVYGIVLNSHSAAVGGFGASKNSEFEHGRDVTFSNVDIHDLRLSVHEIPALYFDKCHFAEATATTIQKGPFGDVFDLRRVIDDGFSLVDEHAEYPASLSSIEYAGNPLADAQIALAVYGDTSTLFGTSLSSDLLEWAMAQSTFPSSCADFVCNGDVMFHQNKGVVGLRMDGIEDAKIEGLTVRGLSNESPLVSSACGSYEGAHDGGLSGTLDDAGGMGPDLRGISIAGGDAIVSGCNTMNDLDSFYGDTIGLDLMGDAELHFDAGSDITINDITSGSSLTKEQFDELEAIGKTPFPNNFDLCTVKYNDDAAVSGSVPGDKEVTDCQINGVFGSNTESAHWIAAADSSHMYGSNEVSESEGGPKSFGDFVPMVLGALVGAAVIAVIVAFVVVMRRKNTGKRTEKELDDVVHVPDIDASAVSTVSVDGDETVGQ